MQIVLISYQRRKYEHPQECILRLEDLRLISGRLINFLRHGVTTRHGQDAWTALSAQIGDPTYASYYYPAPVAPHLPAFRALSLLSPTISSCSSHSSLPSNVAQSNHQLPGSQSTLHGVQHAENMSTSQEPMPSQILPAALKQYMDDSEKARALYLDMLQKQEDSKSQLHAACKRFVEYENVCRDQAKQTFDNLFGGVPVTETVSDVLKALTPSAPGDTQSTVSPRYLESLSLIDITQLCCSFLPPSLQFHHLPSLGIRPQTS